MKLRRQAVEASVEFRVDGGPRTIYVPGMKIKSRIKAGIANQTVEAA